MREVRLSGEQGGPSPPQENAAADRGGDPRLPNSPQEGNREYYQLVRPAVLGPGQPHRRVLRASGDFGAWERQARPPARPCGSRRPSDHAGRLRPREPRPTGTGFSRTHGTADRRPEHMGRPGGHPLRGELPQGSSRGGKAAPRGGHPPPRAPRPRACSGQAATRGTSGCGRRAGAVTPARTPGRPGGGVYSPRAPPAAPPAPAPGGTRAAVRPPGFAPGPPPPGIVPPPPPSSTPPHPPARPARPPAAMNM